MVIPEMSAGQVNLVFWKKKYKYVFAVYIFHTEMVEAVEMISFRRQGLRYLS